ncbi:hypothetical protein B5M09_010555 [Aphanomyces astaci]|uniref:DUF7769 domain-containing protein n=1 Tax=Aphanomyces astaci TaxID=112090 RepID=A0A425CX00_APHAT|nr:hypothetical protein B5M09_010555 [Aphanomyces astaci]
MSTPPRSSRELTEVTKLDLSIALQELARLGKLPRGTINMVATRFGIDRSTVRKVWQCYQQGSMKSRKKGRVGRKHRHKIQDIIAKIREVPQGQRTTMRDLSLATGLSISTLRRALHKGTVTRRSSRLKPLLTDPTRINVWAFAVLTLCLPRTTSLRIEPRSPKASHLLMTPPPTPSATVAQTSAQPTSKPASPAWSTAGAGTLPEIEFSGMWDVVHLDEKWFNAEKDCRKVYLVDGEEVLRRTC